MGWNACKGAVLRVGIIHAESRNTTQQSICKLSGLCGRKPKQGRAGHPQETPERSTSWWPTRCYQPSLAQKMRTL